MDMKNDIGVVVVEIVFKDFDLEISYRYGMRFVGLILKGVLEARKANYIF